MRQNSDSVDRAGEERTEEAEKALGSPEQPPKGRAFSEQRWTSAALGWSVGLFILFICLPCLGASCARLPGFGEGKGSGLYTDFNPVMMEHLGLLAYVLITVFQLTWILV